VQLAAQHLSGDVKLSGTLFLLFLVYQLYRHAHTHAPWLVVLSALDVLVIALTWLEYRRVRSEARRRLS
jgi:uncharacterized membrane protein